MVACPGDAGYIGHETVALCDLVLSEIVVIVIKYSNMKSFCMWPDVLCWLCDASTEFVN